MAVPVTFVVRYCRRGSAAWFHEQRHVQQEERFGLISLTAWLQHLLVVALFLVAWLQPVWVLWFALALLLNDFVLEWDAELYSFRKVGLRRWLNRSWL